jgi:hypothetical protein
MEIVCRFRGFRETIMLAVGIFMLFRAIPLLGAGEAVPPELSAIMKQYDSDQEKLKSDTMRKLTELQKTLLDKNDLTGVATVSQAILRVSGIAAGTQPAGPGGVDLKKGLVLAFRFDKDEAGGMVTDSSEKANTGKAMGTRWTADGKKGGGMQFSLTSSYITVPNNASLNPKEITMAAWIKTSYTDKVWRRIFDKACGKGYDLTIGGDFQGKSFRGQVFIEGAKGFLGSANIVVADGRWHHVVGTFIGGEMRVYIDGNVAATSPRNTSIGTTNYDLTIGANRSNPDGAAGEIDASFNGVMDDVLMYDRALSAEEVKTLFKEGM